MRHGTTPQHRRRLVAETGATGSLLRAQLVAGAVDLAACLCGGEAKAVAVALEDDGAVENVAAQRRVQECAGEGLKVRGLQRGEFVDCGEDGGCWMGWGVLAGVRAMTEMGTGTGVGVAGGRDLFCRQRSAAGEGPWGEL